MASYYKDGYLEAVLFLFKQENKILIEHRPGHETFIPNGIIEQRDLLEGKDYRIVALQREVAEEFLDQVKIRHYIDIGKFHVEDLKIRFYGYLIDAWEGEFPDYTFENNEKFAELQWINIAEHRRYLSFESALFFIGAARKYFVGN